jgi:MFS family permease
MRRLLLLTSTIVLLDVALFAAITPLLPQYVDDLGLSKAQAGILTASYAAGTLLASLPAGYVAARVGPRRTVIGGLVMLAAASSVFGFADNFTLLAAARFTQGITSALTWAGAFTWLVAGSPSERRGAVIGTALGAAIGGALLGPPLGAVASAAGTEPVFSSLAALALVLAAVASRIADSTERQDVPLVHVAATLAQRPVLDATVLVAVPSLLFGAVAVLVPLRIDELGGGAALIAAGFTLGAALEAVLAPLIGRYTDSAGRLGPYVIGMAACAAAILVLAIGESRGIVFVAVLGTSLGAGLCFVPATALLSDAADHAGLHQAYAAALLNFAWASGQVSGSIGAGGAAGAFGNAAPCVAIAALLLTTAIVARRAAPRLAPRPL